MLKKEFFLVLSAAILITLSKIFAQGADTLILGATWTDIKFPIQDCASLYYDSEYDIIYGGAYGGIYKFNSITGEWISMNTDTSASIWPNVKVITMCIDKKGVFYAGADANTLSFVSYDRGNKWHMITQPIVNVVSLFAHDDGTVYFGTATGLYKTTDSAKTFSKVPTPFTYVNVITSDKNGNLLAGSGGVYRSMDKGQTWKQLSLSLPGDFVNSIAVTSDGTIYATSMNDLSKCSDGGATWTSLKPMFVPPGSQFMPKYVTVDDRDNIYFMIWSIYFSSDNAASWKTIEGAKIPNVILIPRGIYVDSKGNIYTINQWGWGPNHVFRGTILPTSVSDKYSSDQPTEFILQQNYPNPFNPTTAIGFQLSAFSKVKLNVYDLLGREVATLVNEEKSPGYYEVKFDGTNLPSGVYFYKLSAERKSIAKKMLLIK